MIAAELTMLLFSHKEMALCSMTGKKSNAHIKSIYKNKIDAERVEAITGKRKE